jgi:hypothetical protein
MPMQPPKATVLTSLLMWRIVSWMARDGTTCRHSARSRTLAHSLGSPAPCLAREPQPCAIPPRPPLAHPASQPPDGITRCAAMLALAMCSPLLPSS